jgi:tRNA(fMet)-specific endonuclease VapC
MYLLDTNACIRVLNNSSQKLIARLQSHSPLELYLCSVVKSELIYGARRSRRVADNLRVLQTFFQPLTSFSFDDRCADEYGMIRADLESKGMMIGANDMLIAATAIANRCILVTHNTREFSRVIGLQLDDWEL